MNTSRMKMFTQRARANRVGVRSAQIISARTGVESRTLKGKEQLGVRGKLGTLFACCCGVHFTCCSVLQFARGTRQTTNCTLRIWVRECNTTLRDGFVLMVVKRGIRCPRIALKSFALKLDNRNVMTANHGIRCKQHMGTRHESVRVRVRQSMTADADRAIIRTVVH